MIRMFFQLHFQFYYIPHSHSPFARIGIALGTVWEFKREKKMKERRVPQYEWGLIFFIIHNPSNTGKLN
jgi:hypothetical protein